MLARSFASVSLALALVACGDDQDPDAASALHERIHAESYRTWRRAPGYEARRASDAPHEGAVDIYVNDVVARALDAKTPITAWPEGSIVVKDGFDGDDHELTAVMWKRADGWFWAEYFGGDSKFSGKPDTCISCHQSGEDFVRAFPLPR